MDQNAFAGRAKRPTSKALALVLGKSHSLWQELLAHLTRELKLDAAEWHSSSVKLGWSLRLQMKKRNIAYMGPRTGYFVAAFILGDRAVNAARESTLPPGVLKMIAEAKPYAEGTAVRIEVRRADDLEVVRTLAKIKIEN